MRGSRGAGAGAARNAGVLRGMCVAEGAVRIDGGALLAMGLVKDGGGELALTPLAVALLGGSYRTLGDLYWGHLGEFLKTAAPRAGRMMRRIAKTGFAAAGGGAGVDVRPGGGICGAQVLAPLAVRRGDSGCRARARRSGV